MKKMLSLLASLAIVSTAASSVVSCGPKVEHDVLLLLPGDVMSQTSKVTKAYKQLVQEFNNSSEMKNSSVKVKAKWETGNAVQQRSSSFQQVPDLYVENGDQTSMHAYDFENGKNVRNMATSAFPDKTEEEATKEIDSMYWDYSFAELGKMARIDDTTEHTFSLSLIKSFDLSVVNAKMVNEILHIAGVESTVDDGKKSGVFDDESAIHDFGNSDAAKLIKANWDKTEGTGNNKLRFFFKSDENVLALSKLYSDVYKSQMTSRQSFWKNEQGISNNLRLFPIGIDDIPNKIMYEYADKIKGNINISDTKDFLYNVTGIKPDDGKMNIEINNSPNDGYGSADDFFSHANSLRINSGDTDKLQAWAGSVAVGKIDGKTYTSNYFNQGTMMEASSSSAGTWAFNYNKDKEKAEYGKDGKVSKPAVPWPNQDNAFNKYTGDLLVVGGASKTGQSFNFMSQGPQLAGFKSVGKNKSEKEKVVTKFIDYLMDKTNQTELALLSGYVPASKDALGEYLPYIKGDVKEKDKDGKEVTVTKPFGASNSVVDPVLTDFINSYTSSGTNNSELKSTTNFISVQPNPAGGMVRSAIGDIMLNYVLADHASFADMFKDAKDLSSLKYYITYNLLPDEFNSSNINYTNE